MLKFIYYDNSIMPFGIYKGRKLANVPAEYLVWLYDNKRTNPPLKKYIEDNKQSLEKEIQNNLNTNKNGKQS